MRFRLLAAALLVCSALSAQTRGDIARIDSLLNSNPEQRRELTLRKASLLKRMYLFDEAAETLTGLLRPDQLDTEVLGEIARNCTVSCLNSCRTTWASGSAI